MDACCGESWLTPVSADTAETLPYTLVQRFAHSIASGPGGTPGGLVTSLVVTSPGRQAGTQCGDLPAARIAGPRPR